MWHPINTIPKDGKTYVVVNINSKMCDTVFFSKEEAREFSSAGSWYSDEDGVQLPAMPVDYYTHWTELPE